MSKKNLKRCKDIANSFEGDVKKNIKEVDVIEFANCLKSVNKNLTRAVLLSHYLVKKDTRLINVLRDTEDLISNLRCQLDNKPVEILLKNKSPDELNKIFY